VLALFPLLAGVPQARLLFNVAFVVVLVSLLVQGTTVAWAARRLRIELPQREGPIVEHALAGGAVLAEFRVADGSPACGTPPESLVLPADCRVVRIHGRTDRADAAPIAAGVRSFASGDDAAAQASPEMVVPPMRPLARGDVVALIGSPQALERCHVLFATARPAAAGRHGGPLAWQFPADVAWTDVCATYGLTTDLAHLGTGATLGEALEALAGRPLVEGDRVSVDRSSFVVIGFEAGRATRFAFEPRPPPGRANRPG